MPQTDEIPLDYYSVDIEAHFPEHGGRENPEDEEQKRIYLEVLKVLMVRPNAK